MSHCPKLLVIEDADFSRAAAVSMFQNMKCEAEGVATGREALAKLADNTYDLIIVDIDLEDMQGMTFVETARHYDANLPMIALTAYNDALIKAQSLSSGMNDFIAKPLTFDTATQLLRTWCPESAETE